MKTFWKKLGVTCVIAGATLVQREALGESSALMLELNIVEVGSAGSPDIHLIARNSAATEKHLQLSLEEGANCPLPANPSWGDPRIGNRVNLTMPAKTWFSLSIPTGLGLRSSLAACEFTAVLSEEVGGHWERRHATSRTLAFKKPTYGSRKLPGTFETSVAVVSESFSHGQAETGASAQPFLNFQILVRNTSDVRRIVGVRERTIICGAEVVPWAWGQNEALSGLGSGPIELSPGAWTIFSQRAQYAKSSTRCSATFEIVELLAANENTGSHWVKVGVVDAKNLPLVLAEY